MGVAVTGMHYTGMTAVSVHITGANDASQSSTNLISFLLAMLAGPLVVLLVAAVIVMFDPDLMVGDEAPIRAVAGTGAYGAAIGAYDPAAPYPSQYQAQNQTHRTGGYAP
jgi:hypothetical protein